MSSLCSIKIMTSKTLIKPSIFHISYEGQFLILRFHQPQKVTFSMFLRSEVYSFLWDTKCVHARNVACVHGFKCLHRLVFACTDKLLVKFSLFWRNNHNSTHMLGCLLSWHLSPAMHCNGQTLPTLELWELVPQNTLKCTKTVLK